MLRLSLDPDISKESLPLRQGRAIGWFEEALAPDDVVADPVRCRAYECDGLTGYRVVPELVLLPRDAEQVAAAVRVCHEHGVPFVARGAGTGLSGGVRCPSRTGW